jgi:hypothetical protein
MAESRSRTAIYVVAAVIAGAAAGVTMARWFTGAQIGPPLITGGELEVTPAMSDGSAERLRADNYRALDTVQEILGLPTAFARRNALHALAGRSDAAALQTHIFTADRIGDPAEREHALEILFYRLAELDAPSALALAESDYFRATRSLRLAVWNAWARQDFDEALFAAKTRSTHAEQNDAAQALYSAFSLDSDAARRIGQELGIDPDREQRNRHLQRLAERSVDDAIEYIESLPTGNYRAECIEWLADYLFIRDASDASRHADDFELASDRQQFLLVIGEAAARSNPRALIDELLARGGNPYASTDYQVAMQALAETDPQAAESYFRAATQSTLKQFIGSHIVNALAATDPKAALAWARANSPGSPQNLYEMTALIQLAVRDPDAALAEALATPSPHQRDSLVASVVGQLAAENPSLAVGMADKIDDPLQQKSARAQILQQWLMTDPDAAVAWVDTLAPAEADELLGNSASILVHSNVDAAIRLLPRVADEYRPYLREQIALQLVEWKSPQAALAFVRQFEGEEGYEALQAGVVGRVAAIDPDQARALADQLADPQLRDTAYVSIARQQALANPGEGLAIAQQIADPELRGQALAGVLQNLMWQDPGSARRVIDSLPPGTARDRALAEALSDWSLMDEFPELVDTISDPALRGQVKASRVYFLWQVDQDQARELLRDPDISEEARREINEVLSGGMREDAGSFAPYPLGDG